MNLILEKTDQVCWFANMREVLDAADITPQNHDWYVSDIETNWTPLGFSPVDQRFSSDELASFLGEHEAQFIWAVFSAPMGAIGRSWHSVTLRSLQPDILIRTAGFCRKQTL